jgi:hypothetical protein
MKKTQTLLALLLVLFLTAVCQATTVERLNLDGLVKKANRIVVGKVRSSRTYWSNNGKLILTNYTIDVQETMKGQARSTVELTTIGGKIGDVTLHVSGMPVFAKGEDAVVFVENTGAYSTVVGLGQGKFTVTNGEVSNSLADLEFPDGTPSKPTKMPLASFKRQIKLSLNR